MCRDSRLVSTNTFRMLRREDDLVTRSKTSDKKMKLV